VRKAFPDIVSGTFILSPLVLGLYAMVDGSDAGEQNFQKKGGNEYKSASKIRG